MLQKKVCLLTDLSKMCTGIQDLAGSPVSGNLGDLWCFTLPISSSNVSLLVLQQKVYWWCCFPWIALLSEMHLMIPSARQNNTLHLPLEPGKSEMRLALQYREIPSKERHWRQTHLAWVEIVTGTSSRKQSSHFKLYFNAKWLSLIMFVQHLAQLHPNLDCGFLALQ